MSRRVGGLQIITLIIIIIVLVVVVVSFRKSSMEEQSGKMIPVIERTVEKISREATINVNQISLQMALDIVGHVLFGLEFDALGGQQDELMEAMMTILHRSVRTSVCTHAE